ncbi:hypothetical protein O1611_g7088 [Lasiodiplodia mahajangana]|uniref:Uncharacterized protein n=1 Tax=Lasiodiplodia mahajangana TaxID=1108764 RepID=A0ACC2JGJ2_9PEZI|nr:hypothetical protein O1611_g7088 [Lasiodiplodia mahajangana]
MLRVFERYELSDNARTLFKALEDFKTSRLDEAGLGRLIRLSPNHRSALVNTMVKCANIMKEKPREAKSCMNIITGCGEMLEIANNPPQEIGFPGFVKLPPEIRDRIYNIYLGNGGDAPNIIPHPKKQTCVCAQHEPPLHERFTKVDLELAFTSKAISAELLNCFYRKRVFHFPCSCEMYYHLKHNEVLKSTIIHLMFHWCGLRSDVGIQQLHKMRQLVTLTVVVSRASSRHLSQRERDIRAYFNTKRNAFNWLPDALGWEELISLRGLGEVKVEHVNRRKGDRRTDDDRKSLENMLNSYLLRPRHDN